MYNIIVLEVLEDFTETVERKMFGHKHVFTTEHKKGETFSVKFSVDERHRTMIDEGKLKIIRDLLEEDNKQAFSV